MKERFGVLEMKTEIMLKIPFFFIEQLMEQCVELGGSLDEHLKQLREDGDNSPPKWQRVSLLQT